MKKRDAKPVYRRDDRVVIVEPLVVTRVGYPLSMEDGIKHVEPLVGKDLLALFDKAGGDVDRYYELPDPAVNDRDYDRVLHAIAHSWLKAQRFGGPERKIHTDLREKLRGCEGRVINKRTVKTGLWHPGYVGGGLDGDYDEPPYLSRAKTHVILEVDVHVPDPEQETRWGFTFPERIEIEARHVRHVAATQPEEKAAA